MQISNLLAMGGYGVYVWSCYGITLSVLALNFLISFFEKKRIHNLISTYYES